MPARATARAHRPAPAPSTEPSPVAPLSVSGTDAPTVSLAGYRGLKVWQRAMDLAAATYLLAGGMPDRILGEELWRTAITIPTNIAAGNAIHERGDYAAHLSVALGKLARLECLLHLIDRLKIDATIATAPLLASAGEINRMLRGLARALQPKQEPEEV